MIVDLDADTTVATVERTGWPHDLARVTIAEQLQILRSPLDIVVSLGGVVHEPVEAKEVLRCHDFFRCVLHVVCLVIVDFGRANSGYDTWIRVAAQDKVPNRIQCD